MKRPVIFLSGAILSVLLFGNFIIHPVSNDQEQVAKLSSLPADVAKVVEKSCFGCHNSESRNEEAKEKLSLESLADMNPMQRAAKVKGILDAVEKGTMPPQRFLERFPDRKLTDGEAKLLKDWAKKELGQ